MGMGLGARFDLRILRAGVGQERLSSENFARSALSPLLPFIARSRVSPKLSLSGLISNKEPELPIINLAPYYKSFDDAQLRSRDQAISLQPNAD